MLIEIPPKFSVSSEMGFLKGKSSIVVGKTQDINIEIENFDVENTMLIR